MTESPSYCLLHGISCENVARPVKNTWGNQPITCYSKVNYDTIFYDNCSQTNNWSCRILIMLWTAKYVNSLTDKYLNSCNYMFFITKYNCLSFLLKNIMIPKSSCFQYYSHIDLVQIFNSGNFRNWWLKNLLWNCPHINVIVSCW